MSGWRCGLLRRLEVRCKYCGCIGGILKEHRLYSQNNFFLEPYIIYISPRDYTTVNNIYWMTLGFIGLRYCKVKSIPFSSRITRLIVSSPVNERISRADILCSLSAAKSAPERSSNRTKSGCDLQHAPCKGVPPARPPGSFTSAPLARRCSTTGTRPNEVA